jgi:hypothetical protein
VARIEPAWTLSKGIEDCTVAERIRLSPAPKLGGWAGKQLRFLSVSRGQSILTDVQHGSFAVKRRVTGLPSMQRMWFGRHGHSLGYKKPRGSTAPAELSSTTPRLGSRHPTLNDGRDRRWRFLTVAALRLLSTLACLCVA